MAIKLNNSGFKFYTYLILIFNASSLWSSEKQCSNEKIQVIDLEQAHLCKSNKYEKYLVGELELQRNDLEKAGEALDEIFSKEEAKEGKDSLFRLFLKQKKFDAIINQKDQLDDSLESNLILLKAYLSLNKKIEAEELLAKLQEKFPDNEQITYLNVASKVELQKAKEALEILNKFLSNINTTSKHFIFYFLKSQILGAMGKEEEAYKAIKESVSLYPKFDQGWKFRAALEEKLGKTNEAINSYKKLLEASTEVEVESTQKLVSLLFNKKRYKEAKEELSKLPQKGSEYYFDLALIEKNLKNYDLAIENAELALQKNPDFAGAKKLKVDLLLLTKNEDAAISTITEMIEADPQNKENIKLILSLKQMKNDEKKLVNFSNEISKKYPNKQILAALIDLLISKNSYKKALGLAEQALKITNQKEDKLKILLTVGQISFRLKQYPKVEIAAQEALSIEKNYAPAQNLLAYTYATENKKLKQALGLIEETLKQNQNNPIFLDTKSLILYKMGNKSEARKILMQAKMISPFNKVINKHEQEFK